MTRQGRRRAAVTAAAVSKLTHRAFRALVGRVIDDQYSVVESVRVALTFYPKNPFEVLLSVSCHTPAPPRWGPIEWTFAVDLLRDGLHRPAGLGDVQVWPGDGALRWPDAGVLFVRLSNPDKGVAVVAVAAQPIRRFLAEVEEKVPRGTEQMEFVPARCNIHPGVAAVDCVDCWPLDEEN
jgi:hypothetical protein